MTALVQIQITLLDNGAVNVQGPMNNQREKEMTYKLLAAALQAVVDFEPANEILVAPAGAIPQKSLKIN